MGNNQTKYEEIKETILKKTINQVLLDVNDINKKYILKEYYLFVVRSFKNSNGILERIESIKHANYIQLKKYFYNEMRTIKVNNGILYAIKYKSLIEEIDLILEGKYN